MAGLVGVIGSRVNGWLTVTVSLGEQTELGALAESVTLYEYEVVNVGLAANVVALEDGITVVHAPSEYHW